jgi:hypothetical protein
VPAPAPGLPARLTRQACEPDSSSAQHNVKAGHRARRRRPAVLKIAAHRQIFGAAGLHQRCR